MIALAVANGSLGVASCSSFDEEPPAEAGSLDEAGGAEGGTDATSEAEGSTSPPLTCVKGTTKATDALSVRPLYLPSSEGFPYGLSTDATHVTWLEQPSADAAFDASFGNAPARVLRIAKNPDASAAPVELARNQPGATAIQVDGSYAYWTTWGGSGSTAKMLRVPINTACGTTCPEPEPVATFPANIRVVRIVRFKPGVFVAQGEAGDVFYVEPGQPVSRMFATGTFPGIAVTSAHLYASSELGGANVVRSTLAAKPSVEPNYLTVPPADGGQVGVGHLAADCTSLWMTQYFSSGKVNIYTHDFARPGSFDFVLQSAAIVNDAVADETYAYGAVFNSGVHVIDRRQKKTLLLRAGDVLRLAIDDDGVYFGERGLAERGAIFMVEKR